VTFDCYGASRPQDEGRPNEDAFWIAQGQTRAAVLCDGAGRAEQCAASVVRLFKAQIENRTLDLTRFPSWSRWLGTVDAGLAGGAQTTFIGIVTVGEGVVGAYAGDSRAYLVNEHGCRLVTDQRTPRLGSDQARPLPIHEPLAHRDVVLLMSDGAWGPLTTGVIHATVMARTLSDLADLPSTLLDLAEARGRADDMTVVALRARR
jgi:serine/threonine protein phosphatase PrpC